MLRSSSQVLTESLLVTTVLLLAAVLSFWRRCMSIQPGLHALQAWTGPEREGFRAMAEKAKALGKPDALFRIVRDLAELSKHYTAISDRRQAVPALAR